jgi:hypothetical protein
MNFRGHRLKKAFQDTLCTSSRASRLTPGFRPTIHEIDIVGFNSKIWARGAKRKSTVALKDLPQGILPKAVLLQDAEAEPAYPTVIQQARNNMRKFSHCVVLTRVGSFYEVDRISLIARHVLMDICSCISSRRMISHTFSTLNLHKNGQTLDMCLWYELQ